jgi:hypothetical protein
VYLFRFKLEPPAFNPRPLATHSPPPTPLTRAHNTSDVAGAPLSSAPEMKNGKASPKLCDQIAHRGDPSCRVVAAGNQSYTAATLVSSLYVHIRPTWPLLPSVPAAPTGLDVVQSAYYSKQT